MNLVLALLLLAAPATDGGTAPSPPVAAKKPKRTISEVKLLYFHASWCGSCRKFEAAKVLESVQERFPKLTITPVDIDVERGPIDRYGVTHTPSLVLVDAGGFPLGMPTIELDDPNATSERIAKLVMKMAATDSP